MLSPPAVVQIRRVSPLQRVKLKTHFAKKLIFQIDVNPVTVWNVNCSFSDNKISKLHTIFVVVILFFFNNIQILLIFLKSLCKAKTKRIN